jgi:hypothetical protein
MPNESKDLVLNKMIIAMNIRISSQQFYGDTRIASENEVIIKRYPDDRLPAEGGDVWLDLTHNHKRNIEFSTRRLLYFIVPIKLIINTFTILANG